MASVYLPLHPMEHQYLVLLAHLIQRPGELLIIASDVDCQNPGNRISLAYSPCRCIRQGNSRIHNPCRAWLDLG